MDISLHPELQAYVEEQVRTGVYQSPSDIINAGLLLLRDHEELMPTDLADLAELRNKIAVGIEQADRGDFVDFDAKEIKAEGQRMLAAKRSH